VLLVIEDDALAELLDELLTEAGHRVARALDAAALAPDRFDVVLVDLDVRARDALALVDEARRLAPATTMVALLPCGGLPAGERVPCRLTIEKPARLSAVLSAVAGARAI
jgi:CheY-like chemotaxis protein